jgi:hypothetical protein
MRPQRSLIKHDPSNGQFGDCVRTCWAAILDMDAKDVPHFVALSHETGRPAWEFTVEFLTGLGYYPITQVFVPDDRPPGFLMKAVSQNHPGLCWIFSGRSRAGSDHGVVVCDGRIVCDPSGNGIVGPMSDGYYWAEFLGSKKGMLL